ncbi:MAG: STAS domain-containing protein [Anaerolineales bacterium]|nr:STAS domain-containing protein [Anaerolineales bacterium]
MKITQRNENGVRLISLDGRLDVDGVAALDQTLKDAFEAGQFKVVLDMGRVQYLNSAGLHTLAQYRTFNQWQGGDLRLVRLSPIVRRVLEVVGFRQFFRNYSSPEAAMIGF